MENSFLTDGWCILLRILKAVTTSWFNHNSIKRNVWPIIYTWLWLTRGNSCHVKLHVYHLLVFILIVPCNFVQIQMFFFKQWSINAGLSPCWWLLDFFAVNLCKYSYLHIYLKNHHYSVKKSHNMFLCGLDQLIIVACKPRYRENTQDFSQCIATSYKTSQHLVVYLYLQNQKQTN